MKLRNKITALLSLVTGVTIAQTPTELIDINPGGSSNPVIMGYVNGKVIFSADDGTNGVELWATDGTTSGTSIIKDINTSGNGSPSFLLYNSGWMYFSATSNGTQTKLWKTMGTSGSTGAINSITNPIDLISYGSLIYGSFNVSAAGEELGSISSSGTTTALSDINPGSSSSSVGNLCGCNGKVFFTAIEATGEKELWSYDTTTTTVAKVKDIAPGTASSFPANFHCINNQTLIFEADVTGTGSRRLFASDGTSSGTIEIAQINTTGSAGISEFIPINSKVYFSADDGSSRQIWVSDGTSSGTNQLNTISSTNGISIGDFITKDNYALVNIETDNGKELWKIEDSDTVYLLKDLYTGSSSSDPQGFTDILDTIYFSATTAWGSELWVTDGTANGTYMKYNIAPSSASSSPTGFISIDSTLIFSATDGTDRELWTIENEVPNNIMVQTEENLRFYPNPSSGLFYHNISVGELVTITNLIGQSFEIKLTSNSIDLTNRSPGVYFVTYKGTTEKLILK